MWLRYTNKEDSKLELMVSFCAQPSVFCIYIISKFQDQVDEPFRFWSIFACAACTSLKGKKKYFFDQAIMISSDKISVLSAVKKAFLSVRQAQLTL